MPNIDDIEKQKPQADPEPEPKQEPQADPEPQGEPEDGEPKDRHGQPGINREKYEREMARRDERISELEAQIAEAAKTEEAKAKLEEEIKNVRAAAEDDRLTYRLELAGCVNVKAAKALIDDYSGDVGKLKDDCPYLFGKDEPRGKTGLDPAGATKTGEADRVDKILGIKRKG